MILYVTTRNVCATPEHDVLSYVRFVGYKSSYIVLVVMTSDPTEYLSSQ
jgi:hypothetical protein